MRFLKKGNRKEVFQSACQAMIDMDLRPLLPMIKTPTLVIGGDEDHVTPWDVGPDGAGQNYIAQHIEGARKYVLEGCNHSSLLERPDENCRVVNDFLLGKD